MAKVGYVNSAMGLYGVGSPTGNLYTNAQSKAKRADKKSQQAENFTKPIGQMNAEEFLYAEGKDFHNNPMYLNADAETQDVMDDDEGQIFPLVDENGKNIELVEGEPIFCIKNGRATGYESNSGSSKSESYITTEKDVFGYVKGTNKNNYTGNFFKVSNAKGRNAHKREWFFRNTPEFGVYRRIDKNGNMTQEPVFINGNAVGRRRSLNVLLNVMTGGAYGATKLAYKIGRDITLLAFSKKERNAVNKEWSPKRKEYNKNIEKLSKLYNDIESKEIVLAGQASSPKDNVVCSGYWNGTLKDYVSMVISSKSKYTIQGENRDSILNHYADGVKLKNYLDSKCKKASGNGANGKAVEYTNILARLYFGSIWNLNYYVFNNKSWNQQTPVIVTAKSILSATKDKESHSGDFQFGFTQSVYDKMPTFHIESVAIAYWLQQLGENGYEKMTDENSEDYYKNMVKVCSYAFWGLYLNPLKTWVNATDRTQQNTAFIRKYMVDVLVSKGYTTNNLVSITKGNGETAEKFYMNQMLENRWVNALSTFEQYPYFDSDYTLLQIEDLYNQCVVINNRNKTLLTEIQKLCNQYKVVKDFNTEEDNRMLFKKSFQNFMDIFNSASNRNKAIKRARELKRELLPLREQGAYLEADMEKIEANMTKIKKDIETYQLILDDESNDQTARDNADKMLDKLTDDLDGWLTKQETKISEHDKLDEKEIKPRETEFENLGAIVTKVMDIYGSYKRKDARRTYRIKKREVKDELKKLYGKGWRKEGNWKDIKIEYKVERNQVLQKYQSIFGKIAHGAVAFLLMPARNIVTILLMLNIGGMTTRLEQMKNVHDGNGKTSDEIKVRNLYELILQRWYSIGGKREFLDKIIAKYGKAKPIANKSGEPDEILAENNLNAEEIASMDSEIKLDATGKQYLNFVVSEYITTILGYVKSFFCWLWAFLKQWGSLICKLFGALFGGKDDEATIGNAMNYDPAETSALELANLELIHNGNDGNTPIDPYPTEAQKEQMVSLIIEQGYTAIQAYEEVMGVKLDYRTDADGNIHFSVQNPLKNWGIGLGVGIGAIALGGILWAVLSD